MGLLEGNLCRQFSPTLLQIVQGVPRVQRLPFGLLVGWWAGFQTSRRVSPAGAETVSDGRLQRYPTKMGGGGDASPCWTTT